MANDRQEWAKRERANYGKQGLVGGLASPGLLFFFRGEAQGAHRLRLLPPGSGIVLESVLLRFFANAFPSFSSLSSVVSFAASPAKVRQALRDSAPLDSPQPPASTGWLRREAYH